MNVPCRAVANIYIQRLRRAVLRRDSGLRELFSKELLSLARDMHLTVRRPSWSISFWKEHIMVKTELYNDDNIDDPPASFATDAEIEIADQLRRQLEERYLGPAAQDSPLRVRSDKQR
jgi:hypothetical protein